MEADGFEVVTHLCDLTKKDQVTTAITKVAEHWGRIEVLVNNAGVSRDMSILKMREEDWDDIININLKSQFLCCQAVLPYMLKNGFGRIVNISSRAMKGNRGQANYASAKGGVISLTKSLAMEFAHKGITVNAICPGAIETPLFKTLPAETKQKIIQSILVGRIGQPEDIGRAVAFFASRDAGYVTGQFFFVCGGRSL